MKKICIAWTLIVLLGLAGAAFGFGSEKIVPAQLPKLSQPLTLDGDLNEWVDAGCASVCYEPWIIRIKPGHKWDGATDASMQVYYAWNSDGFCLAAIVADEDIRTILDEKLVKERDCVRVYVDGRTGDKSMTDPNSLGAYSLVIRPPSDDLASIAIVDRPKETKIEGLKVAGKRISIGYAVEMLVPWSAFPGYSPKPGAEFALQFAFSDSDISDGEMNQPLTMSYQGAKNPPANPREFIRFALTDQIQTGPNSELGPIATIFVPAVQAAATTVPINIEVGKLLADRVGSFHITGTDRQGQPLFDTTASASALPAPWEQSVGGRFEWSPGAAFEGEYTINLVLNDRSGNPLGGTSQSAVYLGDAVDKAIGRLRDANLPKLSQKEPFKAAAYLGVASSIEKLKRGIELRDSIVSAGVAREISARLDVLEKGKPAQADPGLLDLLTLSANPDAQVVVEYGQDSYADVVFYWGAIPIAWASVQSLPSEEKALSLVKDRPGQWGLFADLSEATTLDGLPGRITNRMFDWESSGLSEFASDKQVLLVHRSEAFSYANAIPVDHISYARVNAAIVLPDCPAHMHQAVETWAKDANVPLMDIEQAFVKENILIAGNISSGEAAKKLAKIQISARDIVEGFTTLRVASGNRIVRTVSPVQRVAEQTVRLIVAGKPVKPVDVDTMRAELAASLAPPVKAPKMPKKMNAFAGDLHMHSFYSDGSPSPVGITLEAMYCFMDFSSLTDHNTIEGAVLTQKLLKKYGFNYPLIVGEEITTDQWHMNAYPLKERISSRLSPEETVKAAHEQGAAIHWNHPPYPTSEWALAHTGEKFKETGIDAWEHVPGGYEKLKKAGTLPVLVGATDTHSGTFGPSERTAIIARTPNGSDVSKAVRQGRTTIVSSSDGKLFYGHDDMLATVCAALAEGKGLKASKAAQLKKALKNADIAGLLEASQPRVVKE